MEKSSSLLLMVSITISLCKNNYLVVLLLGDSAGHFIIVNTKSCEGTIYTSGIPTDREMNSVINLTVQASDRGLPPRNVCVYNSFLC